MRTSKTNQEQIVKHEIKIFMFYLHSIRSSLSDTKLFVPQPEPTPTDAAWTCAWHPRTGTHSRPSRERVTQKGREIQTLMAFEWQTL